jgi:transposase
MLANLLNNSVMNKINHFIGIDVSKDTFDTVLLSAEEKESKTLNHKQFENSVSGCKLFLKWSLKQGVDIDRCLVCAEHTGMYVNLIAAFLVEHKINFWLEMSYRIIRSSGIQRGKTDKIDAYRIALYAKKNQDQAVYFKPKRPVIVQLAALLNLREKLIQQKTALLKVTNEYQKFDKEIAKLLGKHQASSIKAIVKNITQIEATIDNLIKSDLQLKKLYTQITSVTGVGKITALTLIYFTNEFKNFDKPRQLACYCGVVPFEHTSGKSVRSKPRVHFMANKQLKKLLHMCALSASMHDHELMAYYQRKVEEGKPKMLVINNIRNKLIHRICACVRDERMFVNNFAA